MLIGVLHGNPRESEPGATPADFASLAPLPTPAADAEEGVPRSHEWQANVKLLLVSFSISGLFTLVASFVPGIRSIPVFGPAAAAQGLWTLNPSLAYVDQGVIMGPATTMHMLLGAVIGWGVLSPLARQRGWAPGPIDDWESGSKGWLVWTSLAIMLADAVISLGHITGRAALSRIAALPPLRDGRLLPGSISAMLRSRRQGYSAVPHDDTGDTIAGTPEPASPLSDLTPAADADAPPPDVATGVPPSKEADAPPEQQISNRVVLVGLALSVLFCVLCIHIVFGTLVPLYATVSAVLVALLLSIMGVRALGEVTTPQLLSFSLLFPSCLCPYVITPPLVFSHADGHPTRRT